MYGDVRICLIFNGLPQRIAAAETMCETRIRQKDDNLYSFCHFYSNCLIYRRKYYIIKKLLILHDSALSRKNIQTEYKKGGRRFFGKEK